MPAGLANELPPYLRIPLHIYVTFIIPELAVEDILALRCTSRMFFVLTCEPRFWKTFLRQIELSCPPIASFDHFAWALEPVDFEPELLVTRALSLETNWKKEQSTMHSLRTIKAGGPISHMKLLPGGKLLIALVSDSEGLYHHIVLFSIDKTIGNGQHAIARYPIPSRPFHLDAKFMTLNGQHGIMINYLQRRKSNGQQCDNSDLYIESFRDEADEYLYSSTSIFSPSESLSALVNQVTYAYEAFNPVMAPPPFIRVANCESSAQMDGNWLFEIDGVPYTAVVQRPAAVVLHNLKTRKVTYINCAIEHEKTVAVSNLKKPFILGLRILPAQRHFIAIFCGKVPDPQTSASGGLQEITVALLYDLPTEEGEAEAKPLQSTLLPASRIEAIEFSDDHPSLPRVGDIPPPISMFVTERTEFDNVVVSHWAIWPSHRSCCANKDGSYTYQYTLESLVHQGCFGLDDGFLLPGVHRGLIVADYINPDSTSSSNRVLRLGRYVHPELCGTFPDNLRYSANELIRRPTKGKNSSINPIMFKTWNRWDEVVDAPLSVDHTNEDGGIGAVEWDEWTGRICVSDGEETLVVMDYAQSFDLAQRHEKWVIQMFPALCRMSMGMYGR